MNNKREGLGPAFVSGKDIGCLMLPSRAMEKMILSIYELEITNVLCSGAFFVELNTQNLNCEIGPTDPDLLLG